MQVEIPINQLDSEDTFTPYVAGKQIKKTVQKIEEPVTQNIIEKDSAVQESTVIQDPQPANTEVQKVTKKSGRPKKKKE